MNIKDSYIHNGTAVLKDVKVENSVLKKILAGKDANDAYLGWETVCDLTGIKPKAAGTADKVGHKLTFSGGVTGTWDGSADKTVAIPTKSSWNYDDVYLKLTGNGTTNPLTGTIYIKDVNGIIINSKDKDLNIWEVYGNSGVWASQYGFNLQYLGTGSGNNNDLVLWAHNKAGTHVETYRVKQDGTFIFKAAPKVGTNIMYHAGNLTIKTLMGTTAIGDSDEPIYWNGSSFIKAGAYPTKASWNYDDRYLKLSGGNLTGKLSIQTQDYEKGYATSQQLVINGPNYDANATLTPQSYPGIGFHMPNRTWANLIWNGSFTGMDGSFTGYVSFYGNGFKKDGSSDNYVLLGGGGHKLLSAFSMAHDHPYLPLSGGTMSNTNKVTNLNADLLDGYHASSFYQNKTLHSDQDSIYDLRFNYGQYDKGDFNGTYKDEYPTNYGSYIALTARDKNIGALMFFDAPISNKLGHIYVRTRGAGDSNTTYSEWGTIAYLTDNVASSSKWVNARTITLTGSVTGSVSIDGSSNVTLSTTTNHTHTKSQITDFPTSLPANGGNADRAKFLETFHQNSTINTYGSQYPIWAQWSDSTNVRLKCTNYTVWTDKATTAITATKIGTSTIGSSTMPVYIKSGAPTAITSFPEAYLSWGGTNTAGSVTPIGMTLSSEHSANRLAFINGNALKFEYSSDAGSTWIDYGYTASIKSEVFTTSYGIPIGRANSSTEYTTNSRTRITLTAQDGTNGYVYTNPRKMLINISSSGGMQVLIEYRTGTNYKNNGAWTTFGTYTLSGWSGWNDIPLILSTLGGGSTQTSNNWQLRLTFIMTSKNGNYPNIASVNCIRIFGENAWTSPSTMAATGHLYSFDIGQNAEFPAAVRAAKFVKSGGTSAQFLKADGSVDSNTYSKSSHTHTFSSLTSKPTTISGYGITDALKIDGSNGTAVGVSALINKLDTGSSTPTDADYYICQYVGGGTTTTTYHRRPMSAMWNWIKAKTDTLYPTKSGTGASGTWSISITGNAKTATTSTYASNVGSSGTAGTNYVTATNVISMYNWYNSITATDEASNTAIDKWNEIVSFLAGITDTSTLSGILAGYAAVGHNHDKTYLKLSGGNVTGRTTIRKDLTGNLSDWVSKQHLGPFEVGRATNSMCVAIGVTDDNYGYIQVKGANITTPGNLVLLPGGGNLTVGNATNTVYHKGNLSIATLMGSTAIGDSDEPVYWNGNKFVKAGVYPTKSSWNYDDRYLKLTGGKITGPVTFEMSNDRKIYINNSDNETYWSLISFQQKGTEYGTLGTAGSTDLQWNGHNLYHAGNLTASVIGSLGTLSNNISGNAATATKATQDGNGNVITNTYLHLSGGTLTGTLGKSNNYIFKPNGGDFRTRTEIYNGAICISLPANIGNTMLSMWIDVYNYSTNKSFSVHVGGYTYNNSNFSNSPFAMVYGASHKVRLTYDNGFKIYIGETNSIWNYPQISIRDVILGFGHNYSNWYNDWSISFVTSFPTINKEITRYAITTDNINNQSVNYANSAGSVAWVNVTGKPTSFTPATHTHTFASLTEKPTTISGYGITDGLRRVTLANNVENDFNTFENLTLTGRGDPTTGSSIVNSPWTTQPAGGFGVLTYLWSGYGLQLAAGYHSNDLYIRNRYYSNSGTAWDTKWDKILNSSNYNSYAPKLDGTGATGTWGISITGSAGSVAWNNVTGKPATATRWPSWNEVTDKPTFTTWSETSSAASYSLSNAAWTNTITLPTTAGSYILNIVSGNSTLTGVFSIGASDNTKDEISLHLHGNGPRLYARTNGTTLQLSSNDASATSRSVTIKYRRMI